MNDHEVVVHPYPLRSKYYLLYTIYMLKNILLGLGIFAALFAVLIFSGKLPIGNSNANKIVGEVVMWGTLPETEMSKVVQAFNPKAETYRVIYKEVREDIFAQALLEALANGTGPDLILAPHQIILSQKSRLYPFPLTSISGDVFNTTYVDGAKLFYSPLGALALPVSIEPMVLFYNRTLFSKHGIIAPPEYWDEVSRFVPILTMQNKQRQFIESAIDLGSPATPYAKDILMTIVAQLGQTPVLTQYNQDGTTRATVLANIPITEVGEIQPLTTAARYFAQFADPTQTTYTWPQSGANATDQFVAEKLAMYVGYSGELETLRARNPKADFEMTSLPQTRGYNTSVTAARMYGIATLKTTRNPTAAFTVEAQFAGPTISPSIAAILGAVPALRSYAVTPGLSSVVARSMLIARAWYDIFPVQSINLTATMISDIINNRQGPSDAANTFVSRLQDLYTPQ